MGRIEYINDETGSLQEARGSDNRLNASSRTDGRGYYNSRDDGLMFTMVWEQSAVVAGEFCGYWQNTDTQGRHLVIASAGINSELAARFKLHFVTGTAAGGSAVSLGNLNTTASNTGSGIANARQGPVTGLTSARVIDFEAVQAAGHEEFRLLHQVRLGQGDAVAIEYHEGGVGDAFGVIFGFYE